MPLVSKNVLFVKIYQLWAVESLFKIYAISIIYANLCKLVKFQNFIILIILATGSPSFSMKTVLEYSVCLLSKKHRINSLCIKSNRLEF